MNRITTNRDFTTESSALTFILAPFDTTWWAGLGWSEARAISTHFLLPQPASAVHLSHCPGEEGAHTHSDALCCRKGNFSAKCSGNDRGNTFTLPWPGRAWQAPSREETWWGQERFPASRLLCALTLNQSDLSGVTLIYLEVVGSRIQSNKLHQFNGDHIWEKGKSGPSVPGATLGADCQGVFFIVCTACLMIGTKLRRGSFLTGHWATRMC